MSNQTGLLTNEPVPLRLSLTGSGKPGYDAGIDRSTATGYYLAKSLRPYSDDEERPSAFFEDFERISFSELPKPAAEMAWQRAPVGLSRVSPFGGGIPQEHCPAPASPRGHTRGFEKPALFCVMESAAEDHSFAVMGRMHDGEDDALSDLITAYVWIPEPADGAEGAVYAARLQSRSALVSFYGCVLLQASCVFDAQALLESREVVGDDRHEIREAQQTVEIRRFDYKQSHAETPQTVTGGMLVGRTYLEEDSEDVGLVGQLVVRLSASGTPVPARGPRGQGQAASTMVAVDLFDADGIPRWPSFSLFETVRKRVLHELVFAAFALED